MNIADFFGGECYVTFYCYNGEVEKINTTADGDSIDANVIVIVNENTASAAEILSSYLKQQVNAIIVGTNTFGKGVFQQDAKLSNGGNLHYTAGYFTVGDWECWQGKGIAPDIEIAMDYDENIIGTDEDIQLQKAIEILG